jgi:hypothetical protein
MPTQKAKLVKEILTKEVVPSKLLFNLRLNLLLATFANKFNRRLNNKWWKSKPKEIKYLALLGKVSKSNRLYLIVD